jgi:deazaflavin-dependent oxidoreductase (nitroreductase family)
MSIAPPASAPRSHFPRSGAARFFNRLVLPLAGTSLLPLYGVVEHRGRRSGRTFRTPVVARPTGDGFVVPLPHGAGTDWCRNVRAAGGCTIRWRGRDYPLTEPELLVGEAARARFGAFQRLAMARIGIDEALRLRHR